MVDCFFILDIILNFNMGLFLHDGECAARVCVCVRVCVRVCVCVGVCVCV